MTVSIKKLITDEYFGIYTRNGIDYILHDTMSEYHIYLLDFDNIKSMNTELGYKKVNEIFKKTFSKMHDKFIIGRAFSGDEIFFCTDNKDAESWAIPYLTERCLDNGLTFKYIHSFYKPKEGTIKDKFNEMIDEFHK